MTKCLIIRYQHHPKLVAALNKFALTDCDMPDKWEKRLDQNGRVRVLICAFVIILILLLLLLFIYPQAIFINHSDRSTSFVDPRLPYPGNNLKSSSTMKNWVKYNKNEITVCVRRIVMCRKQPHVISLRG